MPGAVHPFTHHLARWKEARKNILPAHEQAKNEAIGHIHGAVVSAAKNSPGMDPNHVGAYWYRGKPHISVEQGTETERLEYGDLTSAPRATIRNAARRSEKTAVTVYRQHLKKGLGF